MGMPGVSDGLACADGFREALIVDMLRHLAKVLRHLLEARYLYAVTQRTSGVWSPGHVRYAVTLLVGIALATWWHRWRATRSKELAGPRWSLAMLGVSLLLHVGRIYAPGVPSARIWYISAALLAAGPPVYASVTWATGRTRLPAVRWRAEVLAVGLIVCVAAALWWLVEGLLGVDTALYAAFPYPDLWSPWFDRGIVIVATIMGLIVMAWRAIADDHGGWSVAGWLPGVALFLGAMAWYAVATARHLSHGATGSDPYCYLQMAVDLAEGGTPRHVFPLAEAARETGLPIWPTLPVGYRPLLRDGAAPTVWPIGWPLLLALLYRLGGESLAMWGAPLCNAATAVFVLLLAREMHDELGSSPARSCLVGGLAAALVFTSREVLLRALVPMADAAAQMFSVVSLWALARGYRRDELRWSALAGGLFALAYTVRHPQLWLGFAAPALWVWAPVPWRRRWQHLAAFAGAALLAATPDMVYRTTVFGSLFATESPEWHLIAWRNMPSTAWALLHNGLLRRAEFGYLWPFVGYGFWHWGRSRETRPWACMLGASFVAIVAFSLCYRALRWRDLIAVYPWLALAAAKGLILACDRCRRAERGRAAATWLLVTILMALAARTAHTLVLPSRPVLWTFGHISASQRAEYDRLAEMVPADAIVCTGLGSGAVSRYAGVDTVRPAAWEPDQFRRFGEAAASPERLLYVLDDGTEMCAWIEAAPALWRFEPLAQLALPTFGRGGERLERPAMLYTLSLAQ